MNILPQLPLTRLRIEPNWHVALVHFPIALLVIGLLMELASWVFRSTSARLAARWMLLLGAVLGVPAAVSGLYAMQDLARAGRMIPFAEADGLSPPAWELLREHALIQGAATLGALVVVALYIALGDGGRRAMYMPLLLAMVAVVGATLAGAHHAGQAAYEHGVGTRLALRGERGAATDADAPAVATHQSLHETSHAGAKPEDNTAGWARWLSAAAGSVPPLELHGLLAGLTLATGVVGLAAAWRNTAVLRQGGPAETGRPIFPGTGRADTPRRAPSWPAARLLLATAGLAVAAALAGWWHLANQSGTLKAGELWEVAVPFPLRELTAEPNREELRRPVHVLTGATLLVIPALLAVWTAIRPSGRVVLLMLGVLWLGSAFAQLWTGTLLLWDTPAGPLTGLNALP